MSFENQESDIEDLDKADEEEDRGDFPNMTYDLLSKAHIKIAIFIFFIGLFIFSDLFIGQILSIIPNTTDLNCANTKGTMIQMGVLCMSYLVVDVLTQVEVL